MRIAFDAKRAFRNNTGLGQYSRNLLTALFTSYPQHQYYLATPQLGSHYSPPVADNIHTVMPAGLYKTFAALWRSNAVRHDLKRLNIDLYHGLSHEIPIGLQRTGIRSVVTMHDLIFERYPNQYKALDVAVYRKKFRYACTHADMIIAISQQTQQDLQQFYNVPAEKIKVCYQSCNTSFQQMTTNEQRNALRVKYGLPQAYFLYVGSVIERKNLLTICKALKQLEGSAAMPLAVIGIGGAYMQQVKQYLQEAGLTNKVLFLSERAGGVVSEDMPAIYQGAAAMIYPSVFEGFGIPILEALWSKTPVITSNISCMPETGGNAAYYINPHSVDEMVHAMQQVATDTSLRADMISKGLVHAANFAPEKCAAAVMQVYQSVI